MPVPDVCDKGHYGMMKKFEKNGQEWYSCTFRYADGKTCWGKVPKDAPLYDEDTNTGWKTPPKQQVSTNPTILGEALRVAWDVVVALNPVDDLRVLGDLQVANIVRRIAMLLQTGEDPERTSSMTREEKLELIASLKKQMDAVGVME